jgi:hypothetical protein
MPHTDLLSLLAIPMAAAVAYQLGWTVYAVLSMKRLEARRLGEDQPANPLPATPAASFKLRTAA